MRNPMRALFLLLAASVSFGSMALAHDSWISRGLFRNGNGEFCCGQGDCFMVPPDQVSMIGTGYRLFGAEVVPFSETQPSPDGAFWRCKRKDGSRRCFFAPTPLM